MKALAQSDQLDALRYLSQGINQQQDNLSGMAMQMMAQDQAIQGTGLGRWTHSNSSVGSLFRLDANSYANWSPAHVVKRSEVDQMIWELRQRVENFKL